MISIQVCPLVAGGVDWLTSGFIAIQRCTPGLPGRTFVYEGKHLDASHKESDITQYLLDDTCGGVPLNLVTGLEEGLYGF